MRALDGFDRWGDPSRTETSIRRAGQKRDDRESTQTHVRDLRLASTLDPATASAAISTPSPGAPTVPATRSTGVGLHYTDDGVFGRET